MKKVLTLLVAAIFVFAGTAEAKKKTFKELDTNTDGKLTKEECQGAKYLTKKFSKLDKNKDGFLTNEEIKAGNTGGKKGGKKGGKNDDKK